MKKVAIGGGQGFWGDSPDAAIHMIRNADIQYMGCDYLAELTLSIMAKQQLKDPTKGFAPDFTTRILKEAGKEAWDKHIKICTNAGGMNINGCVDGIRQWAEGNSMSGYKIGYVTGDNIKDKIPQLLKDGWTFPNFDYDGNFNDILDKIYNCNVYIGHEGITGKGQRVDVSLMDSMIAATENTALKYIETGNIPAPMGNRYAAVSPYDSFTCKGGKVIIAAGNQKLYEKLCNEVLERPDMITDPRFVDMPGRLANQDAIAEVIEERIKDLTPNEAAELVLAHGIPAGPIMNIKEILDDPHVKEREMFVEMDHPTLGKVTVNGCAIKLMDTKPSVRTPAPQLGQNNRDIFEGVLGMTEEQFNTLHEKQVFGKGTELSMAVNDLTVAPVATAFLGQFLSTDYFAASWDLQLHRQSEQLLHQIDLTGLV